MNCNICNNEFKYIDGLKFCPYCGSKLTMKFIASEEKMDTPGEEEDKVQAEETYIEGVELEIDQDMEETGDIGQGSAGQKAKIHDTLEMPPITDEVIEREKKARKSLKRSKVLTGIRNVISSKLFVIPFFALIVLGVSGFLAYNYLLNTKVEDAQLKADLIGKTIILPKGTNFQIERGFLKEMTVVNRVYNKEQGVEYIDISTVLNNNSLEVKGSLQVAYKREGRNQWKLMDEITLKNDITVKAVAGKEETKLLQEIKQQKVIAAGEEVGLSEGIVNSIKILQRTPDFEAGKEDVLAEVIIDGGVLQAKGNVVISLSFDNEVWTVDGIKNEADKQFEVAISETLSEDLILEQIQNKGLEEYVAHNSVFGGKSFLVKDKFSRSMTIQSKELDDSKKKLTVTLKRENTAGMLNSTLAATYVFNVSLKGLTYVSNSKSTVEDLSVTALSRDAIAASLSGAEVEGRSDFFWWSDNHKLTETEANTFKLDEILSKTGYKNINYVYGSLTYDNETVSVVALYYLLYDNSKGYVWKLDSVISSESSKYRYYSKESLAQ
ncbi:hypothetical protein [Clostridium thermarum]|uniref:hypothetical protein n=1 Tax=Clostridium thermarum TaxID=1716543 RepID=UPI0013D23566|nr:hypothetical protein [Clostridium thermarum]